MENIDLIECMVDQFKIGKMDEENYNIDLFVFTHPMYWFEEDSKSFVSFEVNNN